MRWIRFFSRVALLCNLVFIVLWVVNYFNLIPTSFDENLIFLNIFGLIWTVGMVVSIPVNLTVILSMLLLLLIRKIKFRQIPVWITLFNLATFAGVIVFWLLQPIY